MKALNDFAPVLLMAIVPILIMLFRGKGKPDPTLTGRRLSQKEWDEVK